jgi:hypothetical protein
MKAKYLKMIEKQRKVENLVDFCETIRTETLNSSSRNYLKPPSTPDFKKLTHAKTGRLDANLSKSTYKVSRELFSMEFTASQGGKSTQKSNPWAFVVEKILHGSLEVKQKKRNRFL